MSEFPRSQEAVTDENIGQQVEQAAVAVDGVHFAAQRRQAPPITDTDRARAAELREEYGFTDTIKFRGTDIVIAHGWQMGDSYGRKTGTR